MYVCACNVWNGVLHDACSVLLQTCGGKKLMSTDTHGRCSDAQAQKSHSKNKNVLN